MSVIRSQADTRSAEYRENAAAMRALVEDLREKSAGIREGGGEAARAKHEARGKLLPRERIRRLMDAGAPFLELSQMAAHEVYGEAVPAAGLRAVSLKVRRQARAPGRPLKRPSMCRVIDLSGTPLARCSMA